MSCSGYSVGSHVVIKHGKIKYPTQVIKILLRFNFSIKIIINPFPFFTLVLHCKMSEFLHTLTICKCYLVYFYNL